MKNRIVVKIGSSLLAEENGKLSLVSLTRHVDSLATLHEAGHEIILVSSGAVAAGFEALGFESRPETVQARQASAAIGQGKLIEAYSRSFSHYGKTVAQILLTRRDFSVRESYNNALATLELLLEKNTIPIVNENDSIVRKDNTFQDNDMLAALVASLVHADRLIILTSSDGLLSADPAKDPEAKLIEQVPEIDESILALAGDSRSSLGSGGMRSKLLATKLALSMGVQVFIGNGLEPRRDFHLAVLDGSQKGTRFGDSSASTLNRKKQWIAFHSEIKGSLVIDDGACKALLEDGKSLLPVGVSSFEGHFEKGDVLEVRNQNGESLGKGVSQYSVEELSKVAGKKLQEIADLLKEEKAPELIHRDSWVQNIA